MDRTYSIGRVLGGGFEVMKRGFVPLVLLSLLFAVIPGILTFTTLLPAFGGLGADPVTQAAALQQINWGALAPALLVTALFTCASYPAMLRGAVTVLEERTPEVLPLAMHGVRKALPFLGLAILMYLGLTLGLILLIVPAFILLVRWSAAMQVLSAEDTGVFGAFARSNALTRGARRKTLAVGIIGFLLLMVVSLGVTFAGGALVAVTGMAGSLVVQTVANVVIGIFLAGIAAAHYLELKWMHGDSETGRLAEVFA